MNDKIVNIKVCKIKKCNKKYYARGLCKKHYSRLMRRGTTYDIQQSRIGVCAVIGCNEKIETKRLCRKHYSRVRKYGSVYIVKKRGFKSQGKAEYPKHYLMKKQRLIKLKQRPFCEVCGAKATQVHHKDLGKDNHSLDNLMSVCRKCNLKSEFRNSKYKTLFGATLQELAECFGVSLSIVYKKIKDGVSLDMLKQKHC